MTTDKFKPSATKHCGEDTSGKMEPSAERAMAKTDLTYSPLAPAIHEVSHNACRRQRAAAAPRRRPSPTSGDMTLE